MATPQEIVSGSYGSVLITGTTAITRNFNTIVVHADAIIAELYYTSDLTTNIIETVMNLGGETLFQFECVFAPKAKTFGKIKLTSGSVFTQ